MITVTIPGHVPSGANLREHWSVKAKRVKAQRQAAFWTVMGALTPSQVRSSNVRVRFVRLGIRPLDGDNLPYSIKAHRDGVADAFGCADNHPRFSWEYAQDRAKKPGLRIELEIA